MNLELIRAVARSSQQDLATDGRAARRAARLRADPALAARLVRSILSSGVGTREGAQPRRSEPIETGVDPDGR
jgi:hypothetical protein